MNLQRSADCLPPVLSSLHLFLHQFYGHVLFPLTVCHRWFGTELKRSKPSCLHVLLPDTFCIRSSLAVLKSTPVSHSLKPPVTSTYHSPASSGIAMKRSKPSRAKINKQMQISPQWFLPQVCWRLQIKGTEKHFRKLKYFTSHA